MRWCDEGRGKNTLTHPHNSDGGFSLLLSFCINQVFNSLRLCQIQPPVQKSSFCEFSRLGRAQIWKEGERR